MATASIGKYKGGLKTQLKALSKTKANDLPMPNTEDAITDYIYNLILRLQKSIHDKGNTASGTLEASFNPLPITLVNGKYTVELKYESYGVGVDEGTKPKGDTKENRAKMVGGIYRWIQNKESLHAIAGEKKKQWSLAYAITRKILKKGTKGSHWLTDVIGKDAKKLETELSAVVSKFLGKDVEVLVTKQANDMLNGNHSK